MRHTKQQTTVNKTNDTREAVAFRRGKCTTMIKNKKRFSGFYSTAEEKKMDTELPCNPVIQIAHVLCGKWKEKQKKRRKGDRGEC